VERDNDTKKYILRNWNNWYTNVNVFQSCI